MKKIKDFLLIRFDARVVSNTYLIFTALYTMFLVLLVVSFWFNLGVFLSMGKLPFWDLIKIYF
jgi:hypothetical protein